MNRIVALSALLTLTVPLYAADPVDFRKQVKPILEVSCLKCHGVEKPKGGLSLASRAGALKGGESGTSLVLEIRRGVPCMCRPDYLMETTT